MATTATRQHWRDRLIARSEAISDAWQVCLAYTGRSAEIVLFVCMIFSIVQMVPTIHMWPALSNGTLIVQMITLDIAGFGLNSLAKAVRRAGDAHTARKAEKMGNTLIAIMIISLVSVAVKNLFSASVPGLEQWIVYLDDALILARIGATVFFGHIIHDLREAQQLARVEEDTRIADLQQQLRDVQATLQQERQEATTKQTELQTKIMTSGKEAERANQQLADMQQSLQDASSSASCKD